MKRAHSKDELVQTGLDLILSKGFNATGIEAILKQASVPKGSFYNYFSSKEEFGLAVIDLYLSEMATLRQPIMEDVSVPPLMRMRKYFEALLARFESNDCSKGCLIGNLSLEMSDQNEVFRKRLEDALEKWIGFLATLLKEAREQGAFHIDVDPLVLAENIVASFEGALLRAKVKKSIEPLKNFIHLYFDIFLI